MTIDAPMTRRSLIAAMGHLGGGGVAYEAMAALGLVRVPSQTAALELPAQLGRGKRVVVLGAGVSGLCAAYELDRAGYEVVVLEAQRRAGGRSLTLRGGSAFKEMGDAPLQYCEFDEGLYLNAGPGRIPHHHVHLIDYCRRFGVMLEPYIFTTRANLLHSDNLPPDKDGRRVVQTRRILFDIQGHVAEMLDKCLDKSALEITVSKADLESLLAKFGDLDQDKRYTNASGHAGYAIPPGLAGNPGKPLGPEALDVILRSRLWDDFAFREMDYAWQASLLQPKGGMDQIVEGFRRQPLARRPGTVDGLVQYGTRVSELAVMGAAAQIAYEDASGPRRLSADFCVSTIPMPVLSTLKSDLPPAYLKTAAALKFMPACKVGWQAKRRFWETDDQIYGGISWTTDRIDQIWYPSADFLSAKGTLTGAYNRGPRALEFGDFPLEARLRIAREDGARLHPGFADLVEHGLAIAWHKMEFQLGGWANEEEPTFGPLIEVLAKPQGRFFPAGDQMTWWTGWQEGAVIAAQTAVKAICEKCLAEPVPARR